MRGLCERLGERFERNLELRGHEVALYSLDRQRAEGSDHDTRMVMRPEYSVRPRR